VSWIVKIASSKETHMSWKRAQVRISVEEVAQ